MLREARRVAAFSALVGVAPGLWLPPERVHRLMSERGGSVVIRRISGRIPYRRARRSPIAINLTSRRVQILGSTPLPEALFMPQIAPDADDGREWCGARAAALDLRSGSEMER